MNGGAGRGRRGRLPPPASAIGLEPRLVALVRRCEVREGVEERDVVLVHAVGQGVVGRLVEVGRERRRAGHGLDGDVDDVVLEAATVREAGVIAARWVGKIRTKITVAGDKAEALQEGFTSALKRKLTGQATRSETQEEFIRVCHKHLDEKDVAVLMDAFKAELPTSTSEK